MVELSDFMNIFTDIPFNKVIGLSIDHLEKGHIITRFNMQEKLIGNFLHGILHGGVISSVLDTTGGALAMIEVAEKFPTYDLMQLANEIGKTSTVNLHIDYLRPGRGQFFIAKAWILRSGKKISVTRMELFNDTSQLIATGNATYLIG